ncbi:unnamed protein product, partial [Staurois parvus]
GVCFAVRKLAVGLKPDVKISNNENGWNIRTESTFKNTDLCFVLNELFEETTADGRTCKTICTLEDGKLIQHQKWDDKGVERESTITREVQNDQMITTIFTLEDGKLIQSQKWDCKESIITREVQNDQMITNCTYGNVKCRRVYEKN